MDRRRFTLAALVLSVPLFLSFPSAVHAQVSWGPDTRLTFAPGWKYDPIVATSGDTVYVVWWDKRRFGGEGDIYFRRSVDGGLTWDPEIRLDSDTIPYADEPTIAVRAPFVHVAWYDFRDGRDVRIRYCRSTDAGITWSRDTALAGFAEQCYHPALACGDNRDVFLTYVQSDSPTSRVGTWLRKSTDEGLTWGRDTLILPLTYYQFPNALCYRLGMLHLIREGNTFGSTTWEILYRRSSDQGVSWAPDVPLSSLDSIVSQWPRITAGKDSIVHVVWADGKYSPIGWTSDIFYRRSTDRGLTWEAIRETLTTLHRALSSDVAVNSSLVHVVWDDQRSGKFAIYYRESLDKGLTWLPEVLLSTGSQDSHLPTVATTNGKVHVAWYDSRDDTTKSEIYYKRGVIVTGVSEQGSMIGQRPGEITLNASPNPFRKGVFIQVFLPGPHKFKLTFYDILGREIKVLPCEAFGAGAFWAHWNGKDYSGRPVPPGVYFLRLEVQGFSVVQKLVKAR